MGAYMMANSDTVLTFDTTEGIERVRRDKDYAFIMESPLARYVFMGKVHKPVTKFLNTHIYVGLHLDLKLT